jgi:hypothetical protein
MRAKGTTLLEQGFYQTVWIASNTGFCVAISYERIPENGKGAKKQKKATCNDSL